MPERIDYAAEAERLLTRSGGGHGDAGWGGLEDSIRGYGLATLALVEQQRIANLIALSKFAFEQYGTYAPTGANLPALFLPPETDQGNVRLNPDIAAALGVKQVGEIK